MAFSNVSCTVLRPGCVCQPKKSVPSYRIVSFRFRIVNWRLEVGGWKLGKHLMALGISQLPTTNFRLPLATHNPSPHQFLSALHGVARCSFPKVVGHHPQAESIWATRILTHAADKGVVAPLGMDRLREVAFYLIHENDAGCP